MRLRDVTLQPTPPTPPEIEGYLKKLKRKTKSISGNWNKRWFFVDPRRREFCYADSKSSAIRSSIYLDDITAVVQFDETHFQVESRTRNFFLWGESKASTACWVSSLESYRKKVIDYEKDKIAYSAATEARATADLATTASAESDKSQRMSLDSRNSRQSVSSTSSSSLKAKKDVGDSSSSTRSLPKNEQRRASPLVTNNLRSTNGTKSRSPTSSRPGKQNCDPLRDRKRNHDRDRDCTYEQDPSNNRDRIRDRMQAKNSDCERSRTRTHRAPNSGRASIMQAWADGDD